MERIRSLTTTAVCKYIMIYGQYQIPTRLPSRRCEHSFLRLLILPCTSTYPQGQAPIIPQLLSLMAAFATLMAFPVFGWDVQKQYGSDVQNLRQFLTRPFMCFQVKVENVMYHGCGELRLNDVAYWDVEAAADEKWAAAFVAAAVFGIVAAIAGSMAFFLLSVATCFALKPRQIIAIVCLQTVGMLFSILTLVAGAANPCGKFVTNQGTTCSVSEARIATGAGFMIFAFFLYISALVMTTLYLKKFWPEKRDNRSSASSQEQATVTKTKLPGGGWHIEKEYTDKGGMLVKEVKEVGPDGEEGDSSA